MRWFASYYNAKFTLFNSRYFQPGTSGINAFSQDWRYENNWLCRPVYLTCKVVEHLRVCRAVGTLVAPVWKSAHYWPILCADGVHWNDFIHDMRVLPNNPKLFLKCKADNSSENRLWQCPQRSGFVNAVVDQIKHYARAAKAYMYYSRVWYAMFSGP